MIVATLSVENGQLVLRGPDGKLYIALGSVDETVPEPVPDEPEPAPSTFTVPTNYGSIQQAIDAAQDGHVIEVLEGTYPERLHFPVVTDLTIRGVGTVEFHGMDTEGANGLTLQDVSIAVAAGATGEAAKYAAFIRSDDVTLRGLDIHDVPGAAIFFKESANPQRCKILDSRLYRIGKGIVVYGDDHLIQNVEIKRLMRDPVLQMDSDYLRASGKGHRFENVLAWGTALSEVEPSHVDGFQAFGIAGRVLMDTVLTNC